MPSSTSVQALQLVNGQYVPATLDTAFDENAKETKLMRAVLSTATQGDEDSVLSTIDRFGWEKEFLMNVGDVKGKIVDDVVTQALSTKSAEDSMVCVELGCYCGYSAVRIGRHLRRWHKAQGANTPAPRFFSLEISPTYAAVAQKIITHAGLASYVTILLGAAGESIPAMRDVLGVRKLDFVFIDHGKEQYLPDFRTIEAAGVLHKGSVVCADNIIYPGAPDYLKYVEESPKLKTVLHKTRLEYSNDREDAVAVSMCL